MVQLKCHHTRITIGYILRVIQKKPDGLFNYSQQSSAAIIKFVHIQTSYITKKKPSNEYYTLVWSIESI